MRPRARRFAATVLEMARCLAAVLLVLATGCGPESTTATIATIEPLDPEDCGCDLVTGDDGIERVEHRLFGCVPVADLVLITFDIAPDGNGLHRTGYHYQNGVAAGDSGTPDPSSPGSGSAARSLRRSRSRAPASATGPSRSSESPSSTDVRAP